jgi:hypothetical protein
VFLGAKYKKWLEKGRLFAKLLDDIIEAAEDDKVTEVENSDKNSRKEEQIEKA